MQDRMHVQDIAAARGRPVYDAAGEMVGDVEAVYYDDHTGEPEWIGIGSGFIATRRLLVPVEGARMTERGVEVPHTRAEIAAAPAVEGDEISESMLRQLSQHFGVVDRDRLALDEAGDVTDVDEAPDDEVAVATPPTPAPAAAAPERDSQPTMITDTPDSVTRSEEELLIGKRRRQAGSVRVRKWVETEAATADVDLEREVVRVVRQPLDQPVDAEIGEAEIEVRLTAEEPVVEKRVVAKERIVLDRQVETERKTVHEELRKEQVEIEGVDEIEDQR